MGTTHSNGAESFSIAMSKGFPLLFIRIPVPYRLRGKNGSLACFKVCLLGKRGPVHPTSLWRHRALLHKVRTLLTMQSAKKEVLARQFSRIRAKRPGKFAWRAFFPGGRTRAFVTIGDPSLVSRITCEVMDGLETTH